VPKPAPAAIVIHWSALRREQLRIGFTRPILLNRHLPVT